MSETVRGRRTTLDSLYSGGLDCYQYENGYRFSIDSILVSHFLVPKLHERILDLGSGCGIIGLILLYRHAEKHIHVTGLEKQSDLVTIAGKNIVLNDFDQQFQISEGDTTDITGVFPPELFSVVITNPPFYMKNSGRLSNNSEELAARHQQKNSLSEFVQAAAYCLKNRGRFVIIYPAGSLPMLFHELSRKKLEPKRVRFIYSYPQHGKEAKLVLVEALKNGGSGMRIEQPLYIFQHKNGPYNDEILKMYDPGISRR